MFVLTFFAGLVVLLLSLAGVLAVPAWIGVTMMGVSVAIPILWFIFVIILVAVADRGSNLAWTR